MGNSVAGRAKSVGKCTICKHPKVAEVDRAIIEGLSFRAVGRKFDLGKDSVARHARHRQDSLNGKLTKNEMLQKFDAVIRMLIEVYADLEDWQEGPQESPGAPQEITEEVYLVPAPERRPEPILVAPKPAPKANGSALKHPDGGQPVLDRLFEVLVRDRKKSTG